VRSDLLKNDILSKYIYYSAAGFLIIKEENLNQKQRKIGGDILDWTRIHPELYKVAMRMCKSALDGDDSVDIVDKVMKNPSKL